MARDAKSHITSISLMKIHGHGDFSCEMTEEEVKDEEDENELYLLLFSLLCLDIG